MIKKYKVLKPIGYGGRQEKGTIVSMDENHANAFGTEYLEEVTAKSDVTEDAGGNEKPVSEMSVVELRAKAKSLGLPTSGSKADLVEAINLKLEE